MAQSEEALQSLKNWKIAREHELYQFLETQCMDILELLHDQEITPAKAVEEITKRKLGLPTYLPEKAE